MQVLAPASGARGQRRLAREVSAVWRERSAPARTAVRPRRARRSAHDRSLLDLALALQVLVLRDVSALELAIEPVHLALLVVLVLGARAENAHAGTGDEARAARAERARRREYRTDSRSSCRPHDLLRSSMSSSCPARSRPGGPGRRCTNRTSGVWFRPFAPGHGLRLPCSCAPSARRAAPGSAARESVPELRRVPAILDRAPCGEPA